MGMLRVVPEVSFREILRMSGLRSKPVYVVTVHDILFRWGALREEEMKVRLSETELRLPPCALYVDEPQLLKPDGLTYLLDFAVLPDAALEAYCDALGYEILAARSRMGIWVREPFHNDLSAATALKRRFTDTLQFPLILPVQALRLSIGTAWKQSIYPTDDEEA